MTLCRSVSTDVLDVGKHCHVPEDCDLKAGAVIYL
jgi:hypothetical protein